MQHEVFVKFVKFDPPSAHKKLKIRIFYVSNGFFKIYV